MMFRFMSVGLLWDNMDFLRDWKRNRENSLKDFGLRIDQTDVL
jgi:hypothetical protein